MNKMQDHNICPKNRILSNWNVFQDLEDINIYCMKRFSIFQDIICNIISTYKILIWYI